MFFEVKQTQKELFAADFHVMCVGEVVGQMHLEGTLGSMEGKLRGEAFGKELRMDYGKGSTAPDSKEVFRPYKIVLGEGKHGCVYQTSQKEGWFSKIDYHQLVLDGVIYNMYPIGFGSEGSKNPIYMGNEQIALIEKDCVVYNELHQYRIYIADKEWAMVALIFAYYMYINAGYKPGVKVTQSVSKTVSTTTNKKLKQKYVPVFCNELKDVN